MQDNQLAAPEPGAPPEALEPTDTVVVADELTTPDLVEPEPAQATQPSPDMEARARDLGWRPKSDWKGHPDAWKPADEFVRRGEEVLPIVRSRAMRAEAKVAELESRVAEMNRGFDDRLKRIDNVSQMALRKQAQQITSYYEGLKRKAVEDGDTARYDQINQQHAQHWNEFQQEASQASAPPEPKETDQPAHQRDPEKEKIAQGWVSKQDWWDRDQVLTKAATEYHQALMRSDPHLTLEDNLAETEKYLQWKYPNRLPQTSRPAPQQQPHAPGVEGGGRQPAGVGRARGWNDLPPEAKTAATKYIEQGLYTNDAKGRAEYASEYWAQPD